MVGRRRRRPRLSGSHQRCWLWGRHAVLEALRAARWLPVELWVAHDVDPLARDEVDRAAQAHRIEIRRVDSARLTQLVGSVEHQGLAARMPEFPYASLDLLHEAAAAVPAAPWLVLDRIQDPHNLGAILRSVDVLGGAGVLIGTREQAEVTPHVARSSAGAVHYVPILRVEDPATVVREVQKAGCLQVVLTSQSGDWPIDRIDWLRPSLVLLGNEGSGVSPELSALADVRGVVPQIGSIGSLNVAVTAGVVLYEALRQRLAAGLDSLNEPAPQ